MSVTDTTFRGDGANESISQSLTAASTIFIFDSEMDNLWANAERLAGGTRLNTQVDGLSERSSTLVKPLHLALELLFDGLHDAEDSRLQTIDPELPRSLQLPLFWTAISQASGIPDDIGLHLREATFKPRSELLLQQCIGQALWQKLKSEQGLENRASSDTNGSESIALHHILLALLEHKELQDILEQSPSLRTKQLPDVVRRLRPTTIRSYDTRLFPVLNQWATDLTQHVKDKKERGEVIDPLIGRCNEMRRLIAILSRRKKNSAVLLGDPGVGKTAIAEGLAQRLVEGVLKVVPESVVARVFNLDLASLLASTACKSAYEQIVKMILDEIAHHEERGIKAIIFMDNLSQIAIGGYRGDGTGLFTSANPLQIKRLPDSAIDLIDETCAQANLARSTNSETVWRLQRSRVVLQMDIRSLKREVDEESDRRLLEAQTKLYNLDRKIEASSSSKRARRIIRRKLKEVDKKIRTEEDRFTLGDPITKEMVAKTAMYYTFIPAAETLDPSEILKVADRLSTVVRTTLFTISDSIHNFWDKVVGQPEAVEAVANTVQYMWAGLKNPRRPIASFLFGGPSGSGKTLLVKGLSEIALRQSGKLLRINASDYIEPHSLTRLIGTPACTGFDHGGQLTECVRRKPFSVVHIKDIERGCMEFRLLIQTILDEGTIRDGDRNVVDFTNCIIIISTSLGQANVGRAISEETERKRFMNEIENYFPGEFLSRLDKIVVFRRMSGATLVTIIHARLEELRKQLSLINLQLLVHDAVKSRLQFQAALIRVGCARWLDRLIRSEILEPLAKLLLKNDVPENKTVVLDIDEDIRKITVRLVEGGPPVPLTEPIPESPVPSSPSASYCSFDTDDEHWENGSTDSHSIDEEEDGHHHESWAPCSLRPLPALSPLPQPQRLY
ncbi:P-loop containing nucleoside triphosphate hydrolase protein [Suillus plorans]|uniref:P-loop containing nucleoside triphosphate hydrolase protein n=1 Tax=Suillus plorans TaxID=116603 RepID=A0A9P7AM58_9AGAM|nr:P-loop containing nucleoside triphosphate hydrolase protein [Suillus plorans]KAG1792322.1 P-loop containing nucleoside triphosphate hydrolase protein [Suillus plorans]